MSCASIGGQSTAARPSKGPISFTECAGQGAVSSAVTVRNATSRNDTGAACARIISCQSTIAIRRFGSLGRDPEMVPFGVCTRSGAVRTLFSRSRPDLSNPHSLLSRRGFEINYVSLVRRVEHARSLAATWVCVLGHDLLGCSAASATQTLTDAGLSILCLRATDRSIRRWQAVQRALARKGCWCTCGAPFGNLILTTRT